MSWPPRPPGGRRRGGVQIWTPVGLQRGRRDGAKARKCLKTVVGPTELESVTSTVSRLSNQSVTDELLAFSNGYDKSIRTAFGPHGPYLASLDLTWTSIGSRVATSQPAFGTTVASRARARLLPPFRCRLAIVETETNLVSLYMRKMPVKSVSRGSGHVIATRH